MKRRIAQLPLHRGKAPAWLFQRMKRLAGAITMAVVDAFGPGEMLRRLADPWWFQAFGCALGFDWHSSGLTTVTCGAVKEAAKACGDDLGILVAGGKGATSRKTPAEIAAAADRLAITAGERLVYASRTAAKVDSAAVQDGFQVYHHSFFFTPGGAWCVVQQGMNEAAGLARRYHWLGESVEDFVCEPHNAISDLSDAAARTRPEAPALPLLNMVAWEAGDNRAASAAIVRDKPEKVVAELARLTEGPTLFLPDHHPVLGADVNLPRLERILRRAHGLDPKNFESLLGVSGLGPATIRALSLLAELIYEAPASHRDPAQPAPAAGVSPAVPKYADYSFAHGGKDGHPFPVDRATYDRSIAVLTEAVRKARIGDPEKTGALRRLGRLAAG
ncbi:MAG: hypothetical protein AMJ81_13600 [Phycisphaerae bacterium SM23_33]|nr:MAG: hypothetical protein AMJ81_13600 [Phycisphaerae bacterium SM23_33]